MSGLRDAAIQVAETIQTAHINPAPDRQHDLNPSTAASEKQPVTFERSPSTDVVSDVEDVEGDEVPLSVLRPTPRKPQLPPLPDLRFEQSYMASIKDTKGWQGVAYITMRDQVVMPLVQGAVWTLAVSGWRFWNSSAKFSGQTVGARIRRWWWDVNNWKIPEGGLKGTLRDQKLAEDAKEFYQAEFSNAGSD